MVPEGFHFGARQIGEASSLLRRGGFHPLEAAFEFAIGFLQGDFGIHADEARYVDGSEEKVADFFFEIGGRCACFFARSGIADAMRGQYGLQNFALLFVQLFEDAL